MALASTILAGCGASSPAPPATHTEDPATAPPEQRVDPTPTSTLPPIETPTPQPTITVSISLYRLVWVEPDGGSIEMLSSARTDEGLREILAGMNDVWSQAGIQFEARYVGPLDVPDDVAYGIARKNLEPFFTQRDDTFSLTDPAVINGVYAHFIGGPNGYSPVGETLFFVTDDPSVYDWRVSAHEVGHALGLDHVLTDGEHLLSPGTNGTLLEDWEVAIARQHAQALVDAERDDAQVGG